MNDQSEPLASQLADELARFGEIVGGPEGLSHAAIQIYIDLLSAPRLTSELDSRFGLQATKAARRQLARWALTHEYRTPAGKTVCAISPRQAWIARAADFTWTVQATPEHLHDLASTGHVTVDAAHELCRHIATLADAVYVDHGDVGVRKRTSLGSSDQIAVALSQLFHFAAYKAQAMSRGPRLPHLAVIWEAIERRVLEGLSYTRLVRIDELAAHGLAIVRRDVLRTGVDLHVGPPDSVNATFYIFDDEVMLRHHQLHVGEIVSHPRHVKGAQAKLERALARSLDALSVVAVLQSRAYDLVARASTLGPHERAVVAAKIANGKFAQRPAGLTSREVAAVEQRLVRERLLVRSSEESTLLPAYGVSFPEAETQLDRGQLQRVEDDVCTTCWCVPSMCYCGEAS